MDYSKLPVAKLKEICREWGLPVSGVKATLLERIKHDVTRRGAHLTGTNLEEQPAQNQLNNIDAELPLNQKFPAKINKPIKTAPSISASSRMKSSTGRNGRDRASSKGVVTAEIVAATDSSSTSTLPSKRMDSATVRHLDSLIDEYIAARGGGQVGSRDVGRYLAANSSSKLS